MPLGSEETYASLRPYLPEDAKKLLETEIPKIRKQVDAEIDTFVQSISDYLQQQIELQAKAIQAESDAANRKLDEILLKLTTASAEPEKLAQATADLRSSIAQYKEKWIGMGKTVKSTALAAARAAGLPIPPSIS